MKDLNRYVKKYAVDWKDIGIELGLELDVLDLVEKDHPHQSIACFQKTLDKWLKLAPNATWTTLEVALTNVRRQQLGLDPVDYGEIFCLISSTLIKFYLKNGFLYCNIWYTIHIIHVGSALILN